MDRTCELALRQAAYMELFRIVFLCGGYPFQQLAFGYSRVIYGNEGDNTAITARLHGDTALSRLACSFAEDYLSISGLDADASGMLKQYLLPLRIRLGFLVRKVLALDRTSRIFHKSLLLKEMAATCLRQYYEKYSQGFTDAIPDWSKKLETRVRHVLGLDKSEHFEGLTAKIMEELAEGTYSITGCSRCKLRHLPPCPCKTRGTKKKGKESSEKHSGRCSEEDSRIKALKYLRENFDSVWNSWSAVEHGRIFKNLRIAEKLSGSEEKGKIPAKLAEACIKCLHEGGGMLFNILLLGTKRIASAAAVPLASGFRPVLQPAVAGVAWPEAVETEKRVKDGSRFLESGHVDRAADILDEVAKIDAHAVRSATLDIFRDDRLSLRLVADSGKCSISVV